jgi:D-alanine-D-alanine ligase
MPFSQCDFGQIAISSYWSWHGFCQLASMHGTMVGKIVTVLMGGMSAEREVSLRSGGAVAEALGGLGYTVHAVDVNGADFTLPEACGVVFPVLHGTFGEDGQLQALLEAWGVPYVGAGVAGSRAAFDKAETRRILMAAGVPVAPGCIVVEGQAVEGLDFPLVVKPACEGSSVGLAFVDNGEALHDALVAAYMHGKEVVVEQFIPGRELTVGIVDGEVLPIVEILAPGGWFDYAAKYTSGTSEYRVPAELPSDLDARCCEVARQVFDVLCCEGVGRVDIRLAADGTPYVLELNTLPGFTATSLLPKAAASAGLAFPQLCERLVGTARCGKPMALEGGA